MILHSKLVPQPEMFMYRWFKPKAHNKWFYYTPLDKPVVSTKQESEIIKTLDKPLADVFMFTSLNGYKTLASCSGHFLSNNEIQEKYRCVLKDLEQIKNHGLLLKDTENEKMYRYKNKNYPNVWDSYSTFKNDIENSMRIGYIGIIKPLNAFELLDGQIEIHTDRKYFDIPVLHIKINNNKESDINLNWSKVLEILKNKL
jgi:hypothetical protein